MKTYALLAATLILTGCATAGPQRALTELELKKAADARTCTSRTRGYGFIPYVGGLVRTVEFDKCMTLRGWDVLSARDREALYGTPDPSSQPAPALLPPPPPPPPPLPTPTWDTGL